MATLAPAGRITVDQVDAETRRLTDAWNRDTRSDTDVSIPGMLAVPFDESPHDRFDLMQLKSVLNVCRQSTSLSDAGRLLFAASRARRRSTNDADRLKKYLARYNLTWQDIKR